MAMNGIAKIITLVLSLISHITANTDYSYRPTTRPRPNRPFMSNASNQNLFIDFENDTMGQLHMDLHLNERSTDRRQREHRDHGEFLYPEQATCIHGLCTNVAGYPKEQIKRLLSRSQFMDGYFTTAEEFLPSIDNRFNTDEISLCETKVHTIYPEKANNTMKVEKVIINVEGHKQGIVFETCVSSGACKFSSSFPTGYTSQCKQKYINKKLMVLGDNDNFVYDLFEVPSCCVCTVVKTR